MHDQSTPLEHLVVEVSDLTGGASVWNGPVSAAGEFEVSGVSPGAYDIMVTGTAGAVVADQVVYLNSPFETIEIPLTNASSERPATGTISITELNHKVPGKAHREALLALKAWKNNDNENCIEHLQMAIAIDPEYLEARRNLGLVYLRLNQPEKVISAYEEVLRIDSRSADAYSYISVAQAQLNHVSEAEDAARRSLAIEAVNRRSRYMLGLLLAEQKKRRRRGASVLKAELRRVSVRPSGGRTNLRASRPDRRGAKAAARLPRKGARLATEPSERHAGDAAAVRLPHSGEHGRVVCLPLPSAVGYSGCRNLVGPREPFRWGQVRALSRWAGYDSPRGLAAVCAVFAIAACTLHAAPITLSGRVVDEDASPVGGARITVRAAGGTAAIQQKQADPTGAFVIDLPGPGDYRIDVEREGYYELKDYPLRVDASQEVTLAVNTIREVFQSININAEPSPVDLAQTQKEERLTGTEINDVPYANSHSLRNSMKLMPGVMEDPTGRLHFNGSSENQVLYVLNGFNITDPISGQFQTRLGVDGIRSLDFASGRYSPEFGKGSAGVLAINTNAGTDAFHYTATDFIPGLDIQQGVRLSNWYPRFGVSGPIVRGRAWFADNFESEYNQSFVNGLPSGQNTRTGWAGANLLHAQVNLTASNILFADFLVNIDNEGRSGLGVLDPVPTTSDLRRREYLGSIKDQVYFGHGALVEFGYAHSDFSDRQIPQGQNLYVFSPQGRSGNYFVNSSQTSSRDQGIVNAYLPAFHFAGTHQIKAGVDADRLQYDGQVARTGYDLIGVSGRLISRTLYSGSGLIHVPDIEQSTYLQDTWRVSERLQVDAGIRQDWDQRISDVAWSPRVAFSWSPFAAGRTRVSGGYTITHDAVNLELLGRPEDQAGFTTYFNADGSPGGSAAPTTFFLGEPLRLPRATNWTASIDHRLTDSITISANYFRRRLDEGFAYINTLDPSGPPSELPLPNSAAGGVYRLENLRRDNYDAEGVTVRQKLSAQYEWMASYVHSHAASNAVLDYNSADPLQVGPTLRPVPWDAPNRLLAWAYLPLPWKNWALPVLADARTGFPFSIQHDNGLISGPVDSHRYPLNFDLNIHLERTFTLRGYRFALRGGMNNVTNQKNPTAVNNVIGAASFLQFYGYEGRHFVARVRFFGRAK